MQQRNRPDKPSEDQAQEALRLLKAIKIAAREASFAEKRTFLRLLDVRVLYDGETLEMSGGVPAHATDLEKQRECKPTRGTFSPPLQSSASADSSAAARGKTSGRCRNNKGSTLRFCKSSLRFSLAISLEGLRKFNDILAKPLLSARLQGLAFLGKGTRALISHGGRRVEQNLPPL